MSRHVVVLVLILIGGISAAGQNPTQRYQKMQAAMVEAQTKASKKGDEKLSCEALQAELVASALDPNVQATAMKLGTWSKEQQDALAAKTAEAKAGIAMGMTVGLMSSLTSMFVPGLSAFTERAAVAGQQANMAQAQAEASRNVQQVAELGDVILTILPQLMRGERVIELAQTRKCAWMQGMMGQQ